MLSLIALVLASAAAFAFSFALDLLFGTWAGVYNNNTAYLPVATWGLVAAVAFVIALSLRPRPEVVYGPCFFFGALALFGAVVGRHPHSYAVAIGMLLEGLLVRQGFVRNRRNLPAQI